MIFEAEPSDWAGSADLLAVARADGFLRFPEGDRSYAAGEPIDFLFPAPLNPAVGSLQDIRP